MLLSPRACNYEIRVMPATRRAAHAGCPFRIQDDTAPFHVDDGVCRTEVDRHVGRQQTQHSSKHLTADPIQKTSVSLSDWPAISNGRPRPNPAAGAARRWRIPRRWDKLISFAGSVVSSPQDIFKCSMICREMSFKLFTGGNAEMDKSLAAAMNNNKRARQFTTLLADFLVSASGIPLEMEKRVNELFLTS